MVDNINRDVGANDTLWHLGDWSFGGIDNVKRFRDRINCNNIFLVQGNHDHHIRKHDWLKNLFAGTYDMWSGKIEGQFMVLSHYMMAIWEHSHKGSWQLFGHSHSSIPDNPWGLNLEIGMDCVYGYMLDFVGSTFFKSDSWGKIYRYKMTQNGPESEVWRTVDLNDTQKMDGGVRLIHQPFTVFNMDQLNQIMKNKKMSQIDHHNSETN